MSPLHWLFLSLLVATLSVQSAQTCPTALPCTCSDRYIQCGKKGLTTVPYFQYSDYYTTLELYENNIEEVPSNAFRNLPKLSRLYISSNKVRTIHRNAFDGLSRLWLMNMNDNLLQTLPDNVFDHLTAMIYLRLDKNRLKNFPVISLTKAVGEKRMSDLYLQDNPNLPCNIKEEIQHHIKTPTRFHFPSPCAVHTCPAPFPCTCGSVTIRCDHKELTNVPIFEFSNIFYKSLYLFGNSIEEIPSNAFRNLPKLTILSIYGNKLTTVHRDAFDGLSELGYLYLDNNQLQTLPDNIFDPLTKLSTLSLSNNNLTDFPVTSLANAVDGSVMSLLHLQENPNLPCNLKEAILSEIPMPAVFDFPSPCGTQTCPAGSPCTCDGITIQCDGEGLTTVPNFAFSDSHRKLVLDNNNIEEVRSNAFQNLPKLTHLSFHNNKLSTIHQDTFYGLSQLEYLSLYINQLQTLPDTIFDALTKLSDLHLHNNKLTEFPVQSLAKAAGGRTMGSIFLHENPYLPCTLQEEILSEIQMPTSFTFPSPCTLPTCPAASPCTCSGTGITCDGKGLTTFPNIQFSYYYTELYLYNNHIEEIPANTLRNLPKLAHLSLSNNNLMTIQIHAFDGLPQLEYLSLFNNQLQTLPDNIFDPLTKLSMLTLNNNKLTNFPIMSLAKAVNGRTMSHLSLRENINLPCNFKEAILSVIQTPTFFDFPSPCGVAPRGLSDLSES